MSFVSRNDTKLERNTLKYVIYSRAKIKDIRTSGRCPSTYVELGARDEFAWLCLKIQGFQTKQPNNPTKTSSNEREKFSHKDVAYQKSRVLHSTLLKGISPRNSTSSQRQNEKITNKG